MDNRTSYDSRIDLVRFFAFFLVFFTHFVNKGGNALPESDDLWWSAPVLQRLADFGGQGVPIFFALTGFLLGRLLIKEYSTHGSIKVRYFYLRRIYRIWPLYFLFVILCLLANPFANGTPAVNLIELPYLLTFTYNWGQIYGSLPGSMATITWSVSVEEQIYFIFPLLLVISKRPRFRIVAIGLVLSGLLTLIMADTQLLPGAARQTTAYLLPVGVGLFCAIYEGALRKNLTRGNVFTLIALLYSIIYPSMFKIISGTSLSNTLTMILTSLLFPAILHLSDKFMRRNSFPLMILARIGRISYGCYLYHWAVWTVMTGKEILYSPSEGFSIIGVIVAFCVTVIISEISYRYFESYFLKRRKSFQRVVAP